MTTPPLPAIVERATHHYAGEGLDNAVRAYGDARAAAEREAIIEMLLALKDRSGVNADGQAWLMRVTKGDCIAAIRARGAS